MYQKVVQLAIQGIILFALGHLDYAKARKLDTSTSNPAFKDIPCPEDEDLPGDFPENPDLCVEVLLPSLDEDMLVLSLIPGTSIYEGYLRNEMDVPVILIDVPITKKRMINFNSDNIPHCSSFDVNLLTDHVTCLRATFNDQNTTDSSLMTRRLQHFSDDKIISLEPYYPHGINIRVLFTFDKLFYEDFDGVDGKSAEEHMEEVTRLVTNAYKDKQFKREIGTHVNIIANKAKYDVSFQYTQDCNEHFWNSDDKDDHDLIAYVTHPGAGGFGPGDVCDRNARRWSRTKGYGPNECNAYQTPEEIECTPTNRLALTSETIAHEIGHCLGMWHDFDDEIYSDTDKFVYRKYENEECKGLMDYIDDGVGWSKCSMLDFSQNLFRHVSSEGIAKCLGGDSSTSCKGGTRPEIEHCCTSTNPCKLNEGDCDDDTECEGDLVCGKNNCGNSFQWISADCCVKKEDPESGECLNGEWKCETFGEGKCLDQDRVNDGRCDCMDGSDEVNGCTPCKLLNPYWWQCNNGECIHESRVNNGVCECVDGSDEKEGICKT